MVPHPPGRIGKGLLLMGKTPAMVGVALFRREAGEPRTGRAQSCGALGVLGICVFSCLRKGGLGEGEGTCPRCPEVAASCQES